MKRNVLKGFRVPVGDQFITVYPNLNCSVFGYRLANGRLAVFGRNETDAYVNVNIGFDARRGTGTISDVLVHSDFPSLPVKTILQVRIAPHDTAFLSVAAHDYTLPSAPTSGEGSPE